MTKFGLRAAHKRGQRSEQLWEKTRVTTKGEEERKIGTLSRREADTMPRLLVCVRGFENIQGEGWGGGGGTNQPEGRCTM